MRKVDKDEYEVRLGGPPLAPRTRCHASLLTARARSFAWTELHEPRQVQVADHGKHAHSHPRRRGPEPHRSASLNGSHRVMGRAHVHAGFACRRGVGKDKTGLSDPYVTVEYDKDVFTTNVCGQTLNPKWDEQVTLYVLSCLGTGPACPTADASICVHPAFPSPPPPPAPRPCPCPPPLAPTRAPAFAGRSRNSLARSSCPSGTRTRKNRATSCSPKSFGRTTLTIFWAC